MSVRFSKPIQVDAPRCRRPRLRHYRSAQFNKVPLVTWIRAHWLFLVNASVGLILAGGVAAPVLAFAGYASAAATLHQLYLWLCPQRASHSYFLLGHQFALEQREIAMFAAQLLGGLVYGHVGRQNLGCAQAARS